ncbi:MAG: hypothetical protein CR981_01100 [Proteobacteria bacterium]|nr:MAG: hypothetical protein CR981_01100 [Pseudomonadota bacterium]PIE65181.1 MAG: hypothetical protein CSA26_04915 [Desulfobacterales bacterium]
MERHFLLRFSFAGLLLQSGSQCLYVLAGQTFFFTAQCVELFHLYANRTFTEKQKDWNQCQRAA